MSTVPILDPTSPQAQAISHLMWVSFVVCGIILGIVTGLIGIIIIRYRLHPPSGEPAPVFGHTKLEIGWTVGALLLLIWLFVLTAQSMIASDPPPHRKPDLVVIGHQWWWEVHYPKSGVVTANEIHIPTGRPLLVRVESADVIHSFWVPELARKMDMIPGHPNHLWLQADKPGLYHGTCSEYCGAEHAWMRILVVAQPPAQFAAWIRSQLAKPPQPTTAAAKRGQAVFEAKTCINCHTITGVSPLSSVAPNLSHLADRQTLGSGRLRNTPKMLAAWLTNPQAYKPGCYMPDLHLTPSQVQALVSYLDTLK